MQLTPEVRLRCFVKDNWSYAQNVLADLQPFIGDPVQRAGSKSSIGFFISAMRLGKSETSRTIRFAPPGSCVWPFASGREPEAPGPLSMIWTRSVNYDSWLIFFTSVPLSAV